MKHVNRIVGLLIVALLFGSQAWAERVSQVDAALVANNFMNVASQNSAVKKAVSAKRMVLKTSAAQEENLYYVYENADGEGWVIVAANDVVTPILAYSETGHFRTDNMPVNVRKWMGKYNNFVKKIEADGVQASEEAVAEWAALKKGTRKAVSVAVVGPLIKTTWDQDAPYWNLCPGTGTNKAYTGCVATAMAQVMNYWQWPVKGTGSHTYQPLDPNSDTGAASKRYGQQTANFGNTTYDWANMKNSYSGSYTEAQATAVATLMYHCGVASEMMYGNDADDGSGTYTVNYNDWEDHACAQNALWMNFGYKKSTITSYMRDGYTYQGTKYYDSWTEANWIAMLKEELDKNHPIMYDGAGPTTNDGGHSFICDGYDNSSTTKFHFNWGWSGDNDGYYTLSNLVPGGGGAGGGSYNFSYDQSVIIGIVPDKPNLPDQNVTWMANGAVFANNIATAGVVTLPTNKPANCEGGKVFVGWTATAEYEAASIAPTYIKGGEIVEEATTYYAVYATQESGSSEATKTFKFAEIAAAKNWENGVAYTTVADAPVTITAEGGGNNGKWYTSGNGSWRMYSGGTVRISAEGSAVTSVTSSPDCNWTITNGEATFSPSARTDFTQIAVTYGGGASYKDYSTACGGVVPPVDPDTFTIGFYNNGKLIGEVQQVVEGQSPEVPAAPEAACTSYTFYGWYTETLAKDNTEKPTVVSNFTAVKDQNYYAVFTKTEADEGGAAVADILTNTTIGITGTQYSSWSGITATSDAVYAGNSAGGNSAIQLRSNNNNSGIVTTTSGGKLAKVSIEWNSNTANDRKLDVYGSNTAYEAASDLYGDNKGTKLGTLTYGGETTELAVTDDYAYVGVRSNNGALYLDAISFTWGGGASSITYYSTVVSCDPTEVSTVKSEELNMKSKKLIIDGKLYIMHDGRMYNVQGTRVK